MRDLTQFLLAPLGPLQGAWGWIAQVFVVVFAVLAANALARRLIDRLHRRLAATATAWDDALVDAIRAPLRVLVWIVGIAFAAEIVRRQAGAPILEAVGPLRDVGVIAALAWFLLRLVDRVQGNLVRRHERAGEPVDHTTVDAVSKLLKATVLITATLVALQTLGFNISGVLAFGGVGGLAVGFAARDLLANFFGALMVHLDRPFEVGDWVRSPDRDIEGTVEQIGWRLTRIRTFDQRPVYVPNAAFTSIAVENPSRMSHRRIFETIGLRYEAAGRVEAVVSEVEAMIRAHPELDTSQTTMVRFDRFGPSSLDFFVYCFTRSTVWPEYHRVKQEVLLKVHEIVTRHGAEVAFPTSTVHVPGGVALRGEARPGPGTGGPAPPAPEGGGAS